MVFTPDVTFIVLPIFHAKAGSIVLPILGVLPEFLYSFKPYLSSMNRARLLSLVPRPYFYIKVSGDKNIFIILFFVPANFNIKIGPGDEARGYCAVGKLGFRESNWLQVEVIQAIATGHDAFGVPIGYEKNLCFACSLSCAKALKTPLLCDGGAPRLRLS